jgi:ABC-type nitrate/sulfonate/bicarbonate transport system ATPase subunit
MLMAPAMASVTSEALALGHRILVMRGPPGRMAGDLAPDLPQPAERTAPEFIVWKRRLSELLADNDPEPLAKSLGEHIRT